jgi:hypothetical protein
MSDETPTVNETGEEQPTLSLLDRARAARGTRAERNTGKDGGETSVDPETLAVFVFEIEDRGWANIPRAYPVHIPDHTVVYGATKKSVDGKGSSVANRYRAALIERWNSNGTTVPDGFTVVGSRWNQRETGETGERAWAADWGIYIGGESNGVETEPDEQDSDEQDDPSETEQ